MIKGPCPLGPPRAVGRNWAAMACDHTPCAYRAFLDWAIDAAAAVADVIDDVHEYAMPWVAEQIRVHGCQ